MDILHIPPHVFFNILDYMYYDDIIFNIALTCKHFYDTVRYFEKTYDEFDYIGPMRYVRMKLFNDILDADDFLWDRYHGCNLCNYHNLFKYVTNPLLCKLTKGLIPTYQCYNCNKNYCSNCLKFCIKCLKWKCYGCMLPNRLYCNKCTNFTCNDCGIQSTDVNVYIDINMQMAWNRPFYWCNLCKLTHFETRDGPGSLYSNQYWGFVDNADFTISRYNYTEYISLSQEYDITRDLEDLQENINKLKLYCTEKNDPKIYDIIVSEIINVIIQNNQHDLIANLNFKI